MSSSVPSVLREAFQRWDSAGQPAAVPSSWTPSRWLARGVPIPAELSKSPVRRDDATRWASRVTADDRATQRDAFVVSMIWGYGRVPYGPYRTKRVMDQPGFDDALAHVTCVTLEQGGVEAFRHIHQARFGAGGNLGFLKYLGPAFGTKYFYFLTRALYPEAVTPVLDEVVRRWFALHASDINVAIGYQWQYASRYDTFVQTMHAWGQELGIAADEVERLIFVQQQGRDGGSWQETWLPETPVLSADQLLTMLGDRLVERGVNDQAEEPLSQLRDLLE